MVGFDSTRPVSLYIHIPFCSSKCDYCAFYSRKPQNEEIDKYLDLLLLELEAVKKEIKVPFYTIFIGGGNPGILGFDRIKKILESAEEYGRPKEVTIECNPGNLNEDILSLSGLLDRVSIGIQSMDESVLKTLGRHQTIETNLKALELLKTLPFRWNADIITAVPGESIETTLSDIRTIASYNPGHISFYCLTFEENTPLIQRETPLEDYEELDFLLKGWEELKKLGYDHYEVSNFARPGEECLHNKVYWNLGQYIGLGPTAESALGWDEMVVMRNTESIEEFFQTHAFNVSSLNKDDAAASYLLTTLRTNRGIDKEEYKERFNKDFDSVYEERISILDRESYVNNEKSFIVTEKGMLTLDSIILTLSMSI